VPLGYLQNFKEFAVVGNGPIGRSFGEELTVLPGFGKAVIFAAS
jgi:hypothetical protein